MKRRNAAMSSPDDQTTGVEQTLAINGRIVLRVSETTAVDANLGVKIHESDRFCGRPETNQVLGFVAIRERSYRERPPGQATDSELFVSQIWMSVISDSN